MKIVSLVAPKSGGKDTVAALLKDLKRSHGKISFAGPLKEICSKIFNIPIQSLNDPDIKELPFKNGPVILTTKHLRDIKHMCVTMLDPLNKDGSYLYNPNRASTTGLENRAIKTYRELMQVIGTDFIRNRIYREWHVRAAFSDRVLAKLPVKSGTYCVTDARFFNEYQFLKETFKDACEFYYVERPEAEAALKEATHDSELEVIKIRAVIGDNQVIKNDGTIDELKEKLKDLKLPEGTTKPKRGFVFVPNNGKQ